MKIYVDADAMPKPLKEVLYKVAMSKNIETIFVAAKAPRLPYSFTLKAVGAGGDFDGADNWIVENIVPNDLVITADIPLADRVIIKKAFVLNTKGDFFNQSNIKNALAMRNLLDELRVSGEITSGPPPFSDKQRTKFINALNSFIVKHFKG